MAVNTVWVSHLPRDVREEAVATFFEGRCGKVMEVHLLARRDEEAICSVRFDDPSGFEQAIRCQESLKFDGGREPLKVSLRPPPGESTRRTERLQDWSGGGGSSGGGKGQWSRNSGRGQSWGYGGGGWWESGSGDWRGGGASSSGWQGGGKANGRGLDPSECLWVGNLPTDVTEEKVRKVFAPFSNSKPPDVVLRQYVPARDTVYAYVTYESVEEASAAKDEMARSTVFGGNSISVFFKNTPGPPDKNPRDAKDDSAGVASRPKTFVLKPRREVQGEPAAGDADGRDRSRSRDRGAARRGRLASAEAAESEEEEDLEDEEEEEEVDEEEEEEEQDRDARRARRPGAGTTAAGGSRAAAAARSAARTVRICENAPMAAMRAAARTAAAALNAAAASARTVTRGVAGIRRPAPSAPGGEASARARRPEPPGDDARGGRRELGKEREEDVDVAARGERRRGSDGSPEAERARVDTKPGAPRPKQDARPALMRNKRKAAATAEGPGSRGEGRDRDSAGVLDGDRTTRERPEMKRRRGEHDVAGRDRDVERSFGAPRERDGRDRTSAGAGAVDRERDRRGERPVDDRGDRRPPGRSRSRDRERERRERGDALAREDRERRERDRGGRDARDARDGRDERREPRGGANRVGDREREPSMQRGRRAASASPKGARRRSGSGSADGRRDRGRDDRDGGSVRDGRERAAEREGRRKAAEAALAAAMAAVPVEAPAASAKSKARPGGRAPEAGDHHRGGRDHNNGGGGGTGGRESSRPEDGRARDDSERRRDGKDGRGSKAGKEPRDEREQKERDQTAPENELKPRKLVRLDNLPADMTREELIATAGDFGEVNDAKISKKVLNGARSAVIEYADPAAIELALRKLDRRRIEGWEQRIKAYVVTG